MSSYLDVARGARAPEPAGWLEEIRGLELSRTAPFLQPSGRVLDFGAGAGYQSVWLQQHGFAVEAVDLASSPHLARRAFPVATYDGHTLPFPDGHFDAVLSSNVLEHVTDLPRILSELARVLKPDGVALHVMPSSSWRWWTTLAEFVTGPLTAIKAIWHGPCGQWAGMPRWRWTAAQLTWAARPFLFRPHGTSGNAVSELWSFSRHAWARRLAAHGFAVERVVPLKLWYTGETMLGPRLSITSRTRLSSWLGSATVLYAIGPRPWRSRA